MKQSYKFTAMDKAKTNVLDFVLVCSQYQANRTFTAMAYAMATDGGWDTLSVNLVNKAGAILGNVYTCIFGGVSEET